MDTKTILSEASDRMQKTIEHLEEELLNIRAGKASPTVLNGVFVDYYGSQTPISGVASVTVPDAKTILIQPWDKNLIRAIEKAIIDSNIGLTPSNNGEQIRLSIPPLTEERRKELVKQVRQEAETARISLRNARRDAVEAFKKAQKEGMSEDEAKDGETQAQKLLDKFTKSLDAILDNKDVYKRQTPGCIFHQRGDFYIRYPTHSRKLARHTSAIRKNHHAQKTLPRPAPAGRRTGIHDRPLPGTGRNVRSP